MNPLSGSHQNDYNTPLTADEEARYQAYRLSLGERGNDRDYDLRGYWKKQGQYEDPLDKADGAHFTDEFKKPNHPTFSVESIYHGTPDGEGGVNEGGRWLGDDEHPIFIPPQAVLDNPDRLKELQEHLANGDKIDQSTRVQTSDIGPG
jgi:hypothetical protein